MSGSLGFGLKVQYTNIQEQNLKRQQIYEEDKFREQYQSKVFLFMHWPVTLTTGSMQWDKKSIDVLSESWRAEDVMGSGCTKTGAGDVHQLPPETIDGEPANATHSADSKKGMVSNEHVPYKITIDQKCKKNFGCNMETFLLFYHPKLLEYANPPACHNKSID